MRPFLRPLPIHPPPDSNESIGRWMEELSVANKTRFDIMFRYIAIFVKMTGDFFQTLSDLTRVPATQIANLKNEFKPEFWKDLKQCPIYNCDYSAEYSSSIFQHLLSHNVGIEWYKCPHCNYEAKKKGLLKRHLTDKHDIGVILHYCPYCNHKSKHKGTLRQHIADKHNMMCGGTIVLFVTKGENKVFRYIGT